MSEYMYPKYTKVAAEVEGLIFPYGGPEYHGGCARFSELDLKTLRKIVDLTEGELLAEYHNDSPTIEEILDHHEKDSEVLVSGYVIEASRTDCRLTVDGILVPEDRPLIEEYVKTCSDFENEEIIDGSGYRRYWWD